MSVLLPLPNMDIFEDVLHFGALKHSANGTLKGKYFLSLISQHEKGKRINHYCFSKCVNTTG